MRDIFADIVSITLLFETQIAIGIANDTGQNNAFKIKISPSPCILEIYSSAPECAIMVCLRHPFESVARTIKQKRLANRDKNPAVIFFCALPCDRRATRGWLNSVRANTDKRQTPSSSSFVCFKRHLFGGLDDSLVASRDSRGWKEVRGAFAGKDARDMGLHG